MSNEDVIPFDPMCACRHSRSYHSLVSPINVGFPTKIGMCSICLWCYEYRGEGDHILLTEADKVTLDKDGAVDITELL